MPVLNLSRRLVIASILATSCLWLRPTPASADPNQCQSDCFRELADYLWDCMGSGMVCIVNPAHCLECIADGNAAYHACLEACSQSGGPSAPYQVHLGNISYTYRLNDEFYLEAGRWQGDEFLSGPGNVTQAAFYLMDAASVPEEGFPPGLPVEDMPWVPLGNGEFDGSRFWRMRVDMSEHVNSEDPTSGFFVRVDLEDSAYSTQLGGTVLLPQECFCPPDWAEQQGTMPPARYGHAAVYDEVAETVILFGGHNGTNGLGDTWSWDGSNWTQLSPSSAPSARWGHMMVYDRGTGRIVLHGGSNSGGYLNETWLWDGNNWIFVSTTGPRCGYGGMAYAADRGRTVLYGGATATGRSRDTWEFDGIVASWTLISLESPPGFRSFHQMVYDDVAERIHMFGGLLPGNVETNDNWVYDDGVWSNLGPSGPSPRGSHQMSVRSSCGTILSYGGEKDGTTYDDLWEYVGEWRQLSAGGEASGPERLASLTCTTDDRNVLFGGLTGAQALGETWVFGCGLDPSEVPTAPVASVERRLEASPNPFNPRTTVSFALSESGPVRIVAYDVHGRRVATLVDDHRPAGRHSIDWIGVDPKGRALPSGVYMIRMEASGTVATLHVGLIR